MLQRHQVLLTDWLAEHLKEVTEKYDLSFSEGIRASLCLELMQFISIAYPQYKPSVTRKMMIDMIKAQNTGRLKSEDLHKFLSQVYFEARKATELWAEQEKKRKKKEKAAAKA